MSVVICAVGDSTSPRSWSGIPWHCLEAGRELGLIDRGLKLATDGSIWKFRRLVHNAFRLGVYQEIGGYQYSDVFLDRLFAKDLPGKHETIINMFQLYPKRIFDSHAGAIWFYVDQTLLQLFEFYKVRIGHRAAADAMKRERQQYHAAKGVIAQSAYAARSLIHSYGVPAGKVSVVLPGANLPRRALNSWQPLQARVRADGDHLRLVFIGKEWKRKGFDRLVRATVLARERGARVELLVIGVKREDLPSQLRDACGVSFAGFIDKSKSADRFIELVSGCDVGCLLSSAEAGGISLREFQRLGLPTIAPDVGGAPDYVVRGASTLIPPEASDAAIASVIFDLATKPAYLSEQRRLAWAARCEASWDFSVKAIHQIITAAA